MICLGAIMRKNEAQRRSLCLIGARRKKNYYYYKRKDSRSFSFDCFEPICYSIYGNKKRKQSSS